MTEFKSTHNLDWEVAPYNNPLWDYLFPNLAKQGDDTVWIRFRIGTVNGIYGSTKKTYDILGIDNSHPGNGHLQDVFDWFENSCKRDNRDLRILECWNTKFRNHLIEKRGFKASEGFNVIKKFRK